MWFYELNRRTLEPYVLAYDRTHAREVRVYKLARMHLAAGGDLHELLSFLLGWGARIEVLGPPEIRARVADEVGRAARRYPDG